MNRPDSKLYASFSVEIWLHIKLHLHNLLKTGTYKPGGMSVFFDTIFNNSKFHHG